MINVWFLIIMFYPPTSGAIVIDNISSLEECVRIAKTMKSDLPLRTYQCVEVIKRKV